MRRIGNFAVIVLGLVFFGAAVHGDDDHGRDHDSRVAYGWPFHLCGPKSRSEVARRWVWAAISSMRSLGATTATHARRIEWIRSRARMAK